MPQNVNNQTPDQVLETTAKLVCIRVTYSVSLFTSRQIGTIKAKLKFKDVSLSIKTVADVKNAVRIYVSIPIGESIIFGNATSGYQEEFFGDCLYELHEIPGGEWSRTGGVVIKVIETT
jgi:hypothetical protein